jgi:cytochrome c biogenesis protein CcdA
MESISIPVLSALWLGILTSVSPCPLASNIAAISYVAKRMYSTPSVIASGILYTLGRVIGYSILGVFITSSLLNIPQTSFFLQNNMNKLLGPILLFAGIFLLDLFQFTIPGISISEKMTDKFKKLGTAGALLLGLLFSLSFCPVSAALFFGSLIPLSLQNSSPVMLPSLYGMGTGLPVLMFAILIAVGIQKLSDVFKKVALIEHRMRRLTGIIFIAVGIYYIFTHLFHMNLI